MGEKEKVWYSEVITPSMEGTMLDLQRESLLSDFYLAGGTGLALHLGHRRSIDLDFFRSELFDESIVLQKAQRLSEFSLVAKEPHTLHVNIQGNKVSFLAYDYPLLFPFELFNNLRVADERDIACMKIAAIASRGTKRDFIDFYMVARNYGLAKLLELFKAKYAQANYSIVHLLKSLIYFEDARKEPMPDMLAQICWREVEQFFLAEVPKLL